ANVWSPGGVVVADAGDRRSRCTSYWAATMLACTALSVASVGNPDVITPSKNVPCEPLLLSPPLPRTMAPCLRIGSYVASTRAPSNMVASAPCWASPPSEAQWCGSPFATAVTNRWLTLGSWTQSLDVLPGLTQPTRMFSSSV